MASDDVGQGQLQNFLRALEADEREIEAAGEEYLAAKARLDVALLRYTALRKFVTETLGHSPYAGDLAWPASIPGAGRRRGKFRFADLGVGDAVINVFREKFGEPPAAEDLVRFSDEDLETVTLTLEEITGVLETGGLGFPETATARSVNAALMNTTGMTRFELDDGQVRYALTKNSVRDLDDLPFE